MNERLKAMGLDKIGVSTETLRLLRALTPDDIKEMTDAYKANEPRMRVSAKDLKALQDFHTAMLEAGTTITNLFAANSGEFDAGRRARNNVVYENHRDDGAGRRPVAGDA